MSGLQDSTVCAHLLGLEMLLLKRVFQNQAGIVQSKVDKDTSVTFLDFEIESKKAMQMSENISVALHSCLFLAIVPIINPSNVIVIMFERLKILIKHSL